MVHFIPGTVITADMIIAVNFDLDSQPCWYRTTNVVWDLRNTLPEPSAGYDAILELVKRFSQLKGDWWRRRKTALVVASKVSFGLSRIYASIVDDIIDSELQIFYQDMPAALCWADSAA